MTPCYESEDGDEMAIEPERVIQDSTCDRCGKRERVERHWGSTAIGEPPNGWEIFRVMFEDKDAYPQGGQYVLCDDCTPEARSKAFVMIDFLGAAIVYPPGLKTT